MSFELTQEMFNWIIIDTGWTVEKVQKLFNIGDTLRFLGLSSDKQMAWCQNQNYKDIFLPVRFLPGWEKK